MMCAINRSLVFSVCAVLAVGCSTTPSRSAPTQDLPDGLVLDSASLSAVINHVKEELLVVQYHMHTRQARRDETVAGLRNQARASLSLEEACVLENPSIAITDFSNVKIESSFRLDRTSSASGSAGADGPITATIEVGSNQERFSERLFTLSFEPSPVVFEDGSELARLAEAERAIRYPDEGQPLVTISTLLIDYIDQLQLVSDAPPCFSVDGDQQLELTFSLVEVNKSGAEIGFFLDIGADQSTEHTSLNRITITFATDMTPG